MAKAEAVAPPQNSNSQVTTNPGTTISDLERRVMATVLASETRGDPSWLCVAKLAQCYGNSEPGFPNADLASILVSNLCFSRNTPYLWKLVEHAMATQLVYPLHVLALLTSRVIQNRHEQPEAYRIYMELMKRYATSFSLLKAGLLKEKMTKSIDDALQLSDTYQVEKMNMGMAVVLFLVTAITSLLDCTLEDWGFFIASPDQLGKKETGSMDVDVKVRGHKKLRQTNAVMALEVVENMCSNQFVQVSLRLVHLNLYASSDPIQGLLQRLELIEVQNLSHPNLPSINHLLERLSCHVEKVKDSDYRLRKWCPLGHVVDTGLVDSSQSHLISLGKASCWVSFDLLMEYLVEGKIFSPAAAFEILTGLIRTLQIVNRANWQETFQALWISALRLVQRARDPMCGPVQYIDSRVSVLLSVVPLCIAPLLKEENNTIVTEGTGTSSRKQSLVASLQSLIQFTSLLDPPQPMVSAANDAATKAAIVVMDFKKASRSLMVPHNYSTKAVGNLLHLVVESCIAKDLIDTSAYLWPDYVVPHVFPNNSNLAPTQDCPWLEFIQGASLTRSLQDALMVIPLPSVIELKKLHHLALHGSEEERSAAPKILCGASLTRSWNIQEHVVHVVVQLLSPQRSLNSPSIGDANLYLSHMHMLAALLSGLSNYSVIQTLALYGMIPEVVAALLPLCEVFGSYPPPSTNQSSTREEVSAYSVFSFAFLFLLRLCKFHGPDKEPHPGSFRGPTRPDLKLDFLLLMRHSRIYKKCTTSMKYYINKSDNLFLDLGHHLVHVDSFPKLRAWYFENEAPDVSNVCNSSRMHQVANKILNLVCRNINKYKCTVSGTGSGGGGGGDSSTTSSASSLTSYSSSPVSIISVSGCSLEDKCQGQPLYPAWELLEAVPRVLDAMLTACAFGRISSRDLITGLIDLVEFFPASIAAIIRYFKAEITCGTWKSVAMNGTDWPSPAEALCSLQQEVKDVLEHVGLHFENWYPHDTPPMLPLPLAAFLSLTITFKLDKKSAYTRGVISQSISNYATISSWPFMLTIGAIWMKKAPRWREFVVSLCTCGRFTNDKDAIDQLLRKCFEAILGDTSGNNNNMNSTHGVVGLLGESVCNSHRVSPGILFLSSCHVFHAPYYFSEVILKLVVELSCQLAEQTFRGSAQLRFGRISLAKAICAVRQVAMLGASLLCIAGRSPLVRLLFEAVPLFLLSKHERRTKKTAFICNLLEGYALSYLLFFSTALMWGVRSELAADKFRSSEMSPHVIPSYLDFIARVTEGHVVLGCDHAMWKAHVCSFVGLVVRLSPAWMFATKLDTLKKLSRCLRGWHEYDLALALLELGGTRAIEAALELLL